jgi:photosystem II stability/assembly factor-like uncharacterized protein
MAIYNPETNVDFLYGMAGSFNKNDHLNSTIFTARASGLFRSINGSNWRLLTEALHKNITVTSVAVSPNYEKDRTVVMGLAGGIIYSYDGGEHWFSANLPSPPSVISSLVFSPGFPEDGIILAGTVEDGVLRSVNRGSSWVAWNFGLLDLGVMSLAISPAFPEDETVIAGTETGLFLSTNGGRAWKEVDLPCGYDPVMSIVISPSYRVGDKESCILFAGTETQGLYRSNDNGKNWSRVGEEFLNGIVQSIQLDPIFPREPGMVVIAGGKIYYSPDNGYLWTRLWAEITDEHPAASILAPHGFSSGSSVWVGMVDGEVVKLTITNENKQNI